MKTALAIVLWIGPLLVGMAFCVWIVEPTPPAENRHQPAEEPARDHLGRLQGTWTGVLLERDGRVVYRGAEAGKASVRFVGDSVKFEDTDAHTRRPQQSPNIPGGQPLRLQATLGCGVVRRTAPPFLVYKVQDGKRTQFASAKIPGDEKWHTLRVTMAGSKITCYLDGQKHLEVEDSRFPEAGKIGLWSKADARSYFDNLIVKDGADTATRGRERPIRDFRVDSHHTRRVVTGPVRTRSD